MLSTKIPIKNFNYLTCIKCVNYIRPQMSNIADDKLGKCQFFKEKNIITGKIENEYAYECRKNKKKCGLMAIHFEPHNFDSL